MLAIVLVNMKSLMIIKIVSTLIYYSQKKKIYIISSVLRKNMKAVLERIIETIKVIGKRGLSFRGAKDAEAAYTLNDDSLDNGNFLEMFILISKFDTLLKEHIDEEKVKKIVKSVNKKE
ncbi:unnamed protein product [Macrosiphum euphorbiae]|uniref:Uncharacterized protein n=1 Tax=Macrosiphum euphorbiae TaxID=13131 RepID=A0AAV0WQD9_9HEMI|nr:unnamed protein product [Macrosiphum euphorbiae]